MKNIKIISLALVAVFAFSAASAASAMAELEFNSSAMGNLTGKAIETQTFTTSAGKVECTALKLLNTPAVLHSKDLHATVDYENCKAFGLAASISPALYLFLINGEVHIIKPITIEAGFGTCEVKVPAQLVSKVTYLNVGNNVVLDPEVTGIKSSGTGTCKYAEEAKGTYVGKSEVELPGAKVEA